MPLFEMEYPLTGQFSALVEADSREDAIRFMKALGDRISGSTGLIDLGYEIAEGLDVRAEIHEFDISGPSVDVRLISETPDGTDV